MEPIRFTGSVEAADVATSFTDATSAVMDTDGAYARFGGKAPGAGSLGTKIRTILNGVLKDAITIAANGLLVTLLAGSTLAAQAITGTTLALSGAAALQAVSGTTFTATTYFQLGSAGGLTRSGNFTQLIDSDGVALFSGGNVASPTSFYDNTTHTFRTKAAATLATLSASVFIVGADPGGSEFFRLGGSARVTSSFVVATGGTNPVKIAQSSDSAIYNVFALNGSVAGTSMIGLLGGGGTDGNLYYYVPSTYSHHFRVNAVDVALFDDSATAGNTRFSVYCVDTAAVQRVKTGASGTGPGGVGRALYV